MKKVFKEITHKGIDPIVVGMNTAASGYAVSNILVEGFSTDLTGEGWFPIMGGMFLLGSCITLLSEIKRLRPSSFQSVKYYLQLATGIIEELTLATLLASKVMRDHLNSDNKNEDGTVDDVFLSAEVGVTALLLLFVSLRSVYYQMKVKKAIQQNSSNNKSALSINSPLIPKKEPTISMGRELLEAIVLEPIKSAGVVWALLDMIAETDVIPGDYAYNAAFAALSLPVIKLFIEACTKKKSNSIDKAIAHFAEFIQGTVFPLGLIMSSYVVLDDTENVPNWYFVLATLSSVGIGLRQSQLLVDNKPYKLPPASVIKSIPKKDSSRVMDVEEGVAHAPPSVLNISSGVVSDISESTSSDNDVFSSSVDDLKQLSLSAPGRLGMFFPSRIKHDSSSSSSNTSVMELTDVSEESENLYSESLHEKAGSATPVSPCHYPNF